MESLLVCIGAPRLKDGGVQLPPSVILCADPERRLYESTAHSRYNALIRRLVRFESTTECVGLSTKR